MSFEELVSIIEKYPDFAHFYGPVEEAKIAEAERLLNLKFPLSYRQFLLKYSGGGFRGLEVHGVETRVPTSESSVVFETLDMRREGYIPDEFIYIMCEDEWEYMIDTSQMKDNEAPVVEWLPGRPESEQSREPVAPTFADFYLITIKELLNVLKGRGKI